MRFGLDLHQYLVPEWIPYYVPYISLKNFYRTIVETSTSKKTQPDFSELYACIDTSIDELKAFHQQQCKFLLTMKTELSMEDGPEHEVHRSLGSLPPTFQERESACMSLRSFRKDMGRLQSFYRVNKEAVDRIFGKIEKRGDFLGEPHRHHILKWMTLKANLQEEFFKLNSNLEEFVPGAMRLPCHDTTSSRSDHYALERSVEYRIIRNDEPSALAKVPEASVAKEASASKVRTLFNCLVETSGTLHSKISTCELLSKAFSATGVMTDHNLWNRLIIAVGYGNRPLDSLQSKQIEQSLCRTCGVSSEECPLTITIDQVYQRYKKMILAMDSLGRLSLHYSALYGHYILCQIIVQRAHAWDQTHASSIIFFLDSQGYSPFDYAVVENHVAVARVFINILLAESQSSEKPDERIQSRMQRLLNIAIRYQFDDMVELLGGSQVHFGGILADEESSLYVAAEIGRDDYLEILLRTGQIGNVDDSEALNGWSPLFIACIHGHSKAAELLLQAGANQEICDLRGWYAKEHAALRGHLSLAELLNSWDRSRMAGGPASKPLVPNRTVGFPLPLDVHYAIVNIGSLQNGRHLKGIHMKMLSSEDKTFTEMLPSVDMSVSVGSSVSHLVHLPVLGDISSEPFIFPIYDSTEVPLVFKFYRTGSLREECELIGSAATLLRSEPDLFGLNRESLFRGRTIPILEKETLEPLGTVTFTFFIAQKPMTSRTSLPIDPYTLGQGTQIVGHRGSGQNTADWSHLQLGENTIESMLCAASQGASYVEFDVQLTRDLVPVVFHDFSLSESGTDVPIHDITFEQFMHASKLQTCGEGSELKKRRPVHRDRKGHRSLSLTTTCEQGIHSIHDRMKYTVDLRSKGFKPNTRGSFIQAPFTTLKDLLVNLPESLSFNVEIKYPRIHEAIEAGVAPVALEMNLFVDRMLDLIFDHARGRRIILSSFTPEICILLMVKQQAYPVMFITNAGKLPTSDLEARACSLQAAVRFSKLWNLAGIVFASDILILCPRLVGYVKQARLICGSYGPMNSVPENVLVQQAAGVQMLMTDKVGVASMALNKSPRH